MVSPFSSVSVSAPLSHPVPTTLDCMSVELSTAPSLFAATTRKRSVLGSPKRGEAGTGRECGLPRDPVLRSIDERLARFVGYYSKAKARLNMNVAVVDLRYPSGFALRPIASAEPTGKQDSKKGK